MKNPESKNPPSILELLKKEEDDLREKTRVMQDGANRTFKDWQKKFAAAEEKEKKIGLEYDHLVGEYRATRQKMTDDEFQAAKAKALKLADVEAGRITMAEFVSAATSSEALLVQARATVDAKLADLRGLVRKKKTEFIEAQVEKLTADREMVALINMPGRYWLDSLRELVKRTEYCLEGPTGMLLHSWNELEQKRAELDSIKQKGTVQYDKWSDLGENALVNLKLDPMFPREYFADLDRAISSVSGTSKKVTIQICHWGPHKGITIW